MNSIEPQKCDLSSLGDDYDPQSKFTLGQVFHSFANHGEASHFGPVATAGGGSSLPRQHFYSPEKGYALTTAHKGGGAEPDEAPVSEHLLFLNAQVARLQAKSDASRSYRDRERLEGAVTALMLAQNEARHG